MNTLNVQLKNEIIQKLDAHLTTEGFKFNKRSQEWSKAISDFEKIKIHLNFGKIIINPSVWYYSDRLDVLWRDSGLFPSDSVSELAQFGQMLTALSGRIYNGDTPKISEDIYSDIRQRGFPYFERLRDFGQVAILLESTNAKDWPVFTRDRRAYSLLIMLAESGQLQKALDLIPSLELGLQGAASVKPPFANFVQWFRQKYKSCG